MNCFFLDKRTEFRPKSLLGHQVDRGAQQVLEVELHSEIAIGSRRSIECNQHIYITAFFCSIAHDRAEQRQTHDAEALRQYLLVLCEQLSCG